jgi:hypothetical protein
MLPAAMNPNAGMSDQEQQMVKAVCDSPPKQLPALTQPTADENAHELRCGEYLV